jgi:hypothetical protein
MRISVLCPLNGQICLRLNPSNCLLYKVDLCNEDEFVYVDPNGIYYCASYDIVRAAAGIAYVIVDYATMRKTQARAL